MSIELLSFSQWVWGIWSRGRDCSAFSFGSILIRYVNLSHIKLLQVTVLGSKKMLDVSNRCSLTTCGCLLTQDTRTYADKP